VLILELPAVIGGLLPEDAGLLNDLVEDRLAAVDREQAVRGPPRAWNCVA
jgi:hypothetical protein